MGPQYHGVTLAERLSAGAKTRFAPEKRPHTIPDAGHHG